VHNPNSNQRNAVEFQELLGAHQEDRIGHVVILSRVSRVMLSGLALSQGSPGEPIALSSLFRANGAVHFEPEGSVLLLLTTSVSGATEFGETVGEVRL
jgi:hypothetical protein